MKKIFKLFNIELLDFRIVPVVVPNQNSNLNGSGYNQVLLVYFQVACQEENLEKFEELWRNQVKQSPFQNKVADLCSYEPTWIENQQAQEKLLKELFLNFKLENDFLLFSDGTSDVNQLKDLLNFRNQAAISYIVAFLSSHPDKKFELQNRNTSFLDSSEDSNLTVFQKEVWCRNKISSNFVKSFTYPSKQSLSLFTPQFTRSCHEFGP